MSRPHPNYAAELEAIRTDLERELAWLAAPGAPHRDESARATMVHRVCTRAAERAGTVLLAAVAAGRLPGGEWLESLRRAGQERPDSRPYLVFLGAVQRVAAIGTDECGKRVEIGGLLADEPDFDFGRDLRLGGFAAAYPRALAKLAARLERDQRRPRPRDLETIRPELRPLAKQNPGRKRKTFPPGVEEAALAWLDEPHPYAELVPFVAERKDLGTLPKSTRAATVRDAVRTIRQRRRDAEKRTDAAAGAR